MIERVRKDVRYALRQWRQAPLLACLVVIGFGVAIGLNTAVFSITEVVFLWDGPFPEPENLVRLGEDPEEWGVGGFISAAAYQDLSQLDALLLETGALSDDVFLISTSNDTREVDGGRVSPGLFTTLGVDPILGSVGSWGARPDQVVLGHAVWTNLFGSDAGVVGRTIIIDDAPYDVVAVMPPRFAIQRFDRIWVPMDLRLESSNRSDRLLQAWGRLSPGKTLSQLESALRVFGERLAIDFPDSNAGWTVGINQDDLSGRANFSALPVLLHPLLGMLLVVACANGAGFVLAVDAGRRPELAIKAALGATRSRLMQQILVEKLLLVLAAGGCGALMFAWSSPVMTTMVPSPVVPPWLAPEVNLPVVLFVVSVTAVAGIIFALVPAFAISRTFPLPGLQENSGVATSAGSVSRSRRLLVVGQIAVTTVLLSGTTVLLTSYLSIVGLDAGYEPDQVLSVEISLPEERYPDQELQKMFQAEVLERLRATPGLLHASFARNRVDPKGLGLGLDDEGNEKVWNPQRLIIRSLGIVDDRFNWSRAVKVVSPEYFQTLQIPRVSGRSFQLSPSSDAILEAVISAEFTKIYWGQRNPLGDRFKLGESQVWINVVGVVGDAILPSVGERNSGLSATSHPTVYLSTLQAGSGALFNNLLVGPLEDPETLAAVVQDALLEIEPNVAIWSIGRMSDLEPTRYILSWASKVSASVAAAACLLAILGLSATVAYTVRARTREIGVRIALGAPHHAILRTVAAQSTRLAYAGVALGMVGSFMFVRLLSFWLLDEPLTHFLGVIGAGVAALLVAIVASYLPARAALQTDAVVALRAE